MYAHKIAELFMHIGNKKESYDEKKVSQKIFESLHYLWFSPYELNYTL